jgi:hypothetical protein
LETGVPYGRSPWNDFEEKAMTQFESICKEALTEQLFEYLYVDFSKKNQNEQIKPPLYLIIYCDKPSNSERYFI